MSEKENRPKWTVVSNTQNGGEWIGTSWNFFGDEKDAKEFYDSLDRGLGCCIRPYFEPSDWIHLGACHTYKGMPPSSRRWWLGRMQWFSEGWELHKRESVSDLKLSDRTLRYIRTALRDDSPLVECRDNAELNDTVVDIFERLLVSISRRHDHLCLFEDGVLEPRLVAAMEHRLGLRVLAYGEYILNSFCKDLYQWCSDGGKINGANWVLKQDFHGAIVIEKK